MTEVYPSDNELLNMQIDSETGVEYIPTGTAPYYIHFRKLLYRLLLAVRRANDLRVYDEGGLDIGVKAGKFWLGTELINYQGCSGNTLADDKDNIYIYLDSQGCLVIDEYDSFPEMSDEPHIRLATISTSSGDIVSITDCRKGYNYVIPFSAGGMKINLEEHTGDGSLSLAQSGSVHTNRGATGTVTLTLPDSAQTGTIFTFAVQANQEFRIDPGNSAIIDDCGQTTGKYKAAGTIGAVLGVIADANGDWVTINKNGTWSEES
jgi:hypothetical protein